MQNVQAERLQNVQAERSQNVQAERLETQQSLDYQINDCDLFCLGFSPTLRVK